MSVSEPNLGGRPPIQVTEATRRKVRRLSGLGMPVRAIAAMVEMGVDSLYKYYKADLFKGKAKTNKAVVGALIKSAKEGNVHAQIYWIKHHCGWKEGGELYNEDDQKKGKIELVTNVLIPVGSANDG